jgi:predicted restriction endonuclease
LEEIVKITIKDEENIKMGLDRKIVVKRRVNQSFFRSAILSAYHLKCAITGLSIPDLLIASHIKPWSKCCIPNGETPQPMYVEKAPLSTSDYRFFMN